MQLKQYTNKFINTTRGKLPRAVFAWYIIVVLVLIVTLIFISYWYYILYGTAYNTSSSSALMGEYKHIIDAQQLKETLEVYGME